MYVATHIAHPGPNRLTLESGARETSLEQSWFQGESPKLRCETQWLLDESRLEGPTMVSPECFIQ
jgi:hypothetical protein